MTIKARKMAAVLAALMVYSLVRAPYWHQEAQPAMLQVMDAKCAVDQRSHKTVLLHKKAVSIPQEEPGFQPLDIALPSQLQEHTWNMCEKYPVPIDQEEFYHLVLRVMWHESRYQPDVPDNRNRNGTLDRGLMQINSCNWNYLNKEYGLDISDPRQNIEAGVLMLSDLLQEYPVEHALTAYALGEAGAAISGGSCKFSKTILSLSLENCSVGGELNGM